MAGSSSPGAADLDRLRSGGYSETDIQAYKADQSNRLLQGGFNPNEVDAYWGEQPRPSPQLDNTVAHNVRLNNPGAGGDSKTASNPFDYFAAGWDTSVVGLFLNKGQPKTVIDPRKAGMFDQIMAMLGQGTGDLPATIAGFGIGATGGGAIGAAVPGAGETGTSEAVGSVIGAGAMSSALPEGMRQVLMDHYKNGDFLSFDDFMKRSAAIGWKTGKSGLIGGASALVGGKLGAGTLKIVGSNAVAKMAEIAGYAGTATTLSATLDGHVPNAEDFAAAAVLTLGFHVAGSTVAGGRKIVLSARGQQVSQNMMDIYARTGIPPWEQARRAKTDNSLKQEIFSTGPEARPVAPRHVADGPDHPPFFHTPGGGVAPETGLPAIEKLENSAGAAAAWNRRHPDNPRTADNIVSPAGAIGKYQVTPGTARQYMGKNYDVNRLFDPAENERVAKVILSDLYSRYKLPDGSPDLEAIYIAYNAGPGRANSFRANGRNYKRLPAETQRYLDRADKNGLLALPAPGKGGGGGGEPPGGPGGTSEGMNLPEKAGMKPEDWKSLDRDELQARIMAQIGEPPKQSMLSRAQDMIDTAYSHYVSELGPLRAVDKELGIGEEAFGIKDAFRSTYASAERAGHFIREGAFDPFTAERLSNDSIMGAYKQAAKAKGGSQEGFIAYRLAKRTVELAPRGIKTGINPDEAAQYIAQARAIYEPAARQMAKAKDGVLDYAERGGLYSARQIAAMKAQGRDHIPLQRVADADLFANLKGGKRRGFQGKQNLKPIEGSDRPIEDPVTAEIEQVHQTIRNADRNIAIGHLLDPFNQRYKDRVEVIPVQEHVVQYLPEGTTPAEVAALPPGRQIAIIEKALAPLGIERAPASEQKIIDAEFTDIGSKSAEAVNEVVQRMHGRMGPQDFIYYRDGQPEVWRARDPLLAKVIKGGTAGDIGVVEGVARWFANVQRSGITTLPDYLAKMVIRDQFTTPIVNKYGGAPFMNLLSGAMEVMRGTETFKEFYRSGGMGSALADMDANYIRRDVDAIFTKTGVKSGIVNSVAHPIEAMRLVMEHLDAMSRVGLYKRAKSAGVESRKAAMLAREGYLDFAEKGTLDMMNRWSAITPFLRPTVLGIDQLVRAFKDHPVSTVTKAAAYITVPSVTLWAMNYLADQQLPDGEKYSDLPRWQRDNFWITPPIAGVRYRIPKPRELGMVFGSLPERMLEWQVQNNPKAFKGWLDNFVGVFMPNVIPTVALPVLENMTDFSFFRGQQLIPHSLEDNSNYMQYTEATTEPAKALARVLGPPHLNVADVSPIVMENYVKQWGGTAGTDVLRILNMPAVAASGRPTELADLPFVSSFVLRHNEMGAAPIEDFYDALERTTKAHKDLKSAIDHDNDAEIDFTSQNADAFVKLNGMAKSLANMRQALKGIDKDPAMTPDEKRQQSDDIYSGMIAISKAGVQLMDAVHDVPAEH